MLARYKENAKNKRPVEKKLEEVEGRKQKEKRRFEKGRVRKKCRMNEKE